MLLVPTARSGRTDLPGAGCRGKGADLNLPSGTAYGRGGDGGRSADGGIGAAGQGAAGDDGKDGVTGAAGKSGATEL
ncbi:hypothetical protein BBN63_34260 [Streptomyces niveus]|uniref:Uncharacterized protein n=1 Tax=Streptomyces niveus TaxID=193462 RepID=A0A1U9R239_STRNV|nr:hypothetical protein BBN63_34260 [Streptomyces niveus]